MKSVSKCSLSDAEKDEFIAKLSPNLLALRTLADFSQGELASLLGISRQTYCAIERDARKMSWNTYLSMVLLFNHNKKTHKMLHMLDAFPAELIVRINDGEDYSNFELSSFLGSRADNIIDALDDQAKQTIHSIVMMEYVRCTQLPSDIVIKSFGGMSYNPPQPKEREVTQAVKEIRKSSGYGE